MSAFLDIEPRAIFGDIEPRVILEDEIEPRPLDISDNITDEELALTESISDPILFSNIYLKTDIWDRQAEIMRAVATKAKVAVKASHSSSKTFTSALLTLWFLAAYEDAVVITTAPTHAQVEKLLWGEIHAALQRCTGYKFPKANLTELKMGPKRYAYGLSTVVTKQDEGVKFQGFHAQHVLVIIDEAPGVNAKIWEAIEGARAGGDVHILAIGNPTITSGPFYNAFTNSRSGWTTFTIDAFDNPNLRGISLDQLKEMSDAELDYNPYPYLANRRWVLEQFYEWGVDHPFWEARVRGQFPKQSEYSLLSLAWLEEQSRRDVTREGKGTGKVSAGLDVAGPGEAETSLTIRRGQQVLVHKQWPISDPRGEIVMELEPYRGELETVNVDGVAIGWYIYQYLLDLKFPAQAIIAQAPSSDSVKYADCKAEFYWSLRLQLSQGKFSGLTDEKTIGQLAGIRWKANSRGQIEIESKESAQKRGVKSPDRAESVMLAYATRMQVYGVLEFFKKLQEEQVNKAQMSQMIKPVTTDQQLSCPVCKAVSVSVCQGGWRCAQCGHQWADKKDKMPQMSRSDMLAKMGRG
jgi:ribosomal protein L37AE/L43A